MKTGLRRLALSCLATLCLTGAIPVNPVLAASTDFYGRPFVSPSCPQEDMSYAMSLANIAYRLILAGDYVDAECRLKQALIFDPALLEARCNLGFVLNREGRPREAISHLLYARQQAPEQAEVLQALAASYQLMGNYDEAIAIYQKYLSKNATASDAWYISSLVRMLKKAESEDSQPATKSAGSENYNWQKKTLKVFVKPVNELNGYRREFDSILQASFAKWSESGILHFSYVDSPEKADIECIWTDSNRSLSAAGEGGETILDHHGNVVAHARIYLLTRHPHNSVVLTDRDIRALCLHEIGHALGLMKHSKHPEDVMFSTLANASKPSSNDVHDLLSHYRNRGISETINSDSQVHLISVASTDKQR